MIRMVLESFADLGYDYSQPMTAEQIDDVQRHCFEKSRGEITYGKFHGALYAAGIKIERVKNIKKQAKGKRKPVVMMDMSGNVLRQFDSVKDAANFVNKEPTSISAALTGWSSSCAGYKWGYVEVVSSDGLQL